MKDLFDKSEMDEMIARINQLTPTTERKWGTMTPAQMFAHCSVAYEMVYEDKHPRPNAFVRFMLKMFVKSQVVGTKPYPQNGRTGPQFIIKDDKDFEAEKSRLVAFMEKTQSLGTSHFDGKESHSMGKLTATEWNNSFSKHLDHHLSQFGV